MRYVITHYVQPLSDQIQQFVADRPVVGIITSLGGAVTTLVSILKFTSLLAGCLGAILALGAGWYTLRIKRHEWRQIVAEQESKKEK